VEDAEAVRRITAEESRAIGIHWNFFPDADVNSNPVNPIINTAFVRRRSKQVGDLLRHISRARMKAECLLRSNIFLGMAYGTDSHLGVARRERRSGSFDSIELPPFSPRYCGGCRFGDGGACHGSGARFRSESCSDDFSGDRLGPARKTTWLQGNHRDRRAGHGRANAPFCRQYWPGGGGGVQGRNDLFADSADFRRLITRCCRRYRRARFRGRAGSLRAEDPEGQGLVGPAGSAIGGCGAIDKAVGKLENLAFGHNVAGRGGYAGSG